MKKLIPLLVGLFSLTGSCTDRSRVADYPDRSGPEKDMAFEVHTTPAIVGTLTIPVEARGKIRSGFEEQVRTQLGGRLDSCIARNGLMVKKGDLLARMETIGLELRRERLLAQRFHAQKEYESQYLGYSGLLEEKSPAEAEEVRQKLRISSGLTVLNIDLREVDRELESARIKAPVNGVIAEVNVAAGMTLLPGQELFRIYDPAYLFLEARVPETDLSRLRIGLHALVMPLSETNPPHRAVLEAIDPQVGTDGLVRVHLRLRDCRGLFPGMSALAKIEVPQKKGILIPRQALVIRDERPVVFTVEKGRAQWNYVVPGEENGDYIEIVEGIPAGSEVIISNQVQLAHQALVVPVKSPLNPDGQ